jgi:hypothetical protein
MLKCNELTDYLKRTACDTNFNIQNCILLAECSNSFRKILEITIISLNTLRN